MRDDDTLRVEIKFKNARLYRAIWDHSRNYHADPRNRAVYAALGPVYAFCRLHDLSSNPVYRLLNLTLHPLRQAPDRSGLVYRDICVRLAAILEQDVGYLFPIDLYERGLRPQAHEMPHRVFAPLRAAARVALPPPQEATVESAALAQHLAAAISTLTPREQTVVRLCYGLEDGEEWTMAQVGQRLGVTASRVQQIECKALRKLRHTARAIRTFLA